MLLICYFIYVVSKNGDRECLSYVTFAHPQLKQYMKNPQLEIFIDGTFAVAPHPFSQLLVLMYREPITDSYLPIYYILLQRKCEWVYNKAFELLLSDLDLGKDAHGQRKKINVLRAHVDFEKALINSVRVRTKTRSSP